VSNQITTAHVQQYKDNVLITYQQAGSKLRGSVQERTVTGRADFWDRVDQTAAQKKLSRNSDTPLVNTPHSRRMVTLQDYEWADLIDKQDAIRILIDPQSAYAVNAGYALGRSFDDEVINAFDGIAYGAIDGSTQITFSSEKAGDEDFSGAALTVPNLVQVKLDLDAQDVPDEGRHIVMRPAGFAQLLKQSTAPMISNADYNTVKALVNGEIDTFLGFKFHRTTRMPQGNLSQDGLGANLSYGFAWHEKSMGISVGMEFITRVTERSDKSYATQVYVAGSFGATRLQGNGVVRFKINETN
jgi:hypothetical protein